MLEIKGLVKVHTPKGKGTVWLVDDPGNESPLLLHVVLDSDSRLYSFTQQEIVFERNFTAGRGNWADLNPQSTDKK